MDLTKCRALKEELTAQDEPQLVAIDRFFDGNDDEGSIGCNLIPHPGMDKFRETFLALQRRSDVEAIYAQISELDPGDDCWPYTDTVLLMGSISPDELWSAVEHLQPDEVSVGDVADAAPSMADRHQGTMCALWWD